MQQLLNLEPGLGEASCQRILREPKIIESFGHSCSQGPRPALPERVRRDDCPRSGLSPRSATASLLVSEPLGSPTEAPRVGPRAPALVYRSRGECLCPEVFGQLVSVDRVQLHPQPASETARRPPRPDRRHQGCRFGHVTSWYRSNVSSTIASNANTLPARSRARPPRLFLRSSSRASFTRRSTKSSTADGATR